MKRLILVIPFLMLALAGTTLAAQDPEIRELIDRMRALEETVESQRQEIEFQRGEIEGLKAGQAGSRGPRRYEPVALRSPGEAEYGVSDEKLHEAVKDYLGTEQGRKLITDTSPFKLKAGYKKGKGFYLETLDEKFKMYIYNRLQVRYTFADSDESGDTSSFRIRRYKIKFAGHAFTKDLTYKVQWNLPSNSGTGKMKRLILVIPFLMLALAGTTLAAQDPEIRELIDRMRALEETVEFQRQEIESQRGEIEGLKAGQAGSRGPRRYEPVALRSPGEAEYGVSDEKLHEAVK
ncbi:MAG: hypothetical protein V3V54_03440, partial [Candidatus Brocadiales bacterium]